MPSHDQSVDEFREENEGLTRVSSDREEICDFLLGTEDDPRDADVSIVFCTYQSSELLGNKYERKGVFDA